jgi:hypothetical protein
MDNKFLVYKASGGLAHMFGGLKVATELAIKSNRILIVDTMSNPAFRLKFSEIFRLDIPNLKWVDDYSVIPNEYTYKDHMVDELKDKMFEYKKGGYYSIFDHNVLIKNKDKHEAINSQDKIIVYSGNGNGFTVSINFRVKLIDSIKKLLSEETLISEPYISVHFRNTDLKNNHSHFLQKIKKQIDNTQINTVYLASDDYDMYDHIINQHPDIRLVRYTIPPKNIFNLHLFGKDRFKQIYESIRDIYMIMKSTYFIPSYNSGFSQWIIAMINSGDNIFDIPNNTHISNC